MQFLKIMFWCLLAFIAAIFTYGNWTTVQIKLWSGLVAEVNLPLLLFITLLVGLVPTMIYYNALIFGIFLGFLALGYGYFYLTRHRRALAPFDGLLETGAATEAA